MSVNGEATFSYFVGYGFMLFLLAVYVYVRFTYWARPTPALHLTDLITIFGGLYLLDFLLDFADGLLTDAQFMDNFPFHPIYPLQKEHLR